jgi:hypothetical protein
MFGVVAGLMRYCRFTAHVWRCTIELEQDYKAYGDHLQLNEVHCSAHHIVPCTHNLLLEPIYNAGGLQGRGVTLAAADASASTFCWGYHVVWAAFVAQRHKLVPPTAIVHPGVAVETLWLSKNVSVWNGH